MDDGVFEPSLEESSNYGSRNLRCMSGRGQQNQHHHHQHHHHDDHHHHDHHHDHDGDDDDDDFRWLFPGTIGPKCCRADQK